jgi:ATP-dependent DNA helicase RecQ
MASTTLVRHAMQNAARHTDGQIEMLLKRIEALEKTVAELSAVPRTEPSAQNDTLYNALREKRMAIATEMGIPAYCVATNKMLNAVVQMKPTTVDELRTIYGFGPNKVKLYGETILKVVADWS